MVRLKRRVGGVETVAHGFCQLLKRFPDVRRKNEVGDRPQVRGRAFVEKRRGIRCQRIVVALLSQESVDGQIIADDARAAFGRAAALGDSLCRRVAFADGGEQFEFNCGLQRLRSLITIQSIKDDRGTWLLSGLSFWSHDYSFLDDEIGEARAYRTARKMSNGTASDSERLTTILMVRG